jgi:hypothetical protein
MAEAAYGINNGGVHTCVRTEKQSRQDKKQKPSVDHSIYLSQNGRHGRNLIVRNLAQSIRLSRIQTQREPLGIQRDKEPLGIQRDKETRRSSHSISDDVPHRTTYLPGEEVVNVTLSPQTTVIIVSAEFNLVVKRRIPRVVSSFLVALDVTG